MSKLRNKNQVNATAALVQSLQNTRKMRSGFGGSTDLVKSLVSLESLTDEGRIEAVQQAGDVVEQNLGEDLISAVAETGQQVNTPEEAMAVAGVTAAGMEAATIIALAASSPLEYATAIRRQASVEGMRVFDTGSSGAHGTVAFAQPAMEAFDTNSINKFVEHSIAYNMAAPRQDAFGEAFFPTMVLTPDQTYFKAIIDRVMVYQGAVHKLDGDIAKFEKNHLLDAYRNPNILKNDATVLVPYRAEDDSNAKYFVDDALVPVVSRVVDKTTVPTSPLKINEAMDILGLSSHPGLIQANVMDQSDAVDANVRLANLYVLVSNGSADPQVVKFDVSKLPLNQFIKSSEGMSKDTALRFHNRSLTVKGTTKDVLGADVTAFAALAAAGLTVKLEAEIDGRLNLERGELRVKGSDLQVFRIFDSEGMRLASSNALNGITFTVLGYDLDARRTNSNRRSRGLLLDNDMYEEAYLVGLLPPMSIQTPTAPYKVGSEVKSLVDATHVAISNNAVTTLLNYADQLKAYVDGTLAANTSGETLAGGDIEGIGRLLVTAHYEEHEVDLEAMVANISTKDKLKDIQGQFISMIQEIGYRMLQLTGYRPALEVTKSAGGAKPTLLIGTDTVLPAFMQIQGDDRISGILMDHEVVSSPDSRMFGNIFITFKAGGEGFQPLNFGNFAYIPELVSSIPVNRSGATVEETMVQPRYRHICNLPILAKIVVKGLDVVVKQRLLINTN